MICRFDKLGLYAALDQKRRSLAMSWQGVAHEIGVAASTIARTQQAGPMETDGMLAMVRWLGCAPETFIKGGSSLRASGPSTGRFNVKALYRVLDEKRIAKQMTWNEVCAELGGNVSPGMLTRLRRGGRIDAHLMVACVGWLSVPVSSFTRE